MPVSKLVRRIIPNAFKPPMRRVRMIATIGKSGLLEWFGDHVNALPASPNASEMIDLGLEWMKRAQDNSTTKDGGVARHYHYKSGWGSSYPETTGYIIPTFLQHAKERDDDDLRQRAIRMLEFEKSIQMSSGAFQGSTIGCEQVHPVVFDTGQILQGLAAGVAAFGDDYRPAMNRTAEWLARSLDPDGVWRVPNPYSMPGKHVWETHVAWGLLEAARVEPDRGYGEAALRNIRWAAAQQIKNGWFPDCCLDDARKPLTHTIGYALRGMVEGYLFSKDHALLDSCLRAAHSICSAVEADGYLSGRLDHDWRPAARWVCLTGSSQISICLMLLFQETREKSLLDAALRLNRFVRSTVRKHGSADLRGGVKGSLPVSGDYSPFEMPNWACKFTVDAATLELRLTA